MPSFPLVRGRRMRVTRVGRCCDPLVGDDNQVVTDGFVSVALTANITTPEEITVTNANGQTCVRDPGCPEFNGYGVEITFCDVDPCLFSLVTGQPVVLDAAGEAIGFRMNSDIDICGQGFALEVWMGVPGVACGEVEEGSDPSGYLLLPCLQAGVIGDFTIENAAVNFTITGASTKDGNGWGTGPYADTQLVDPLDANDHLYVAFTTTAPPDPTDGCAPVTPITTTPAVTSFTPTTGAIAGGDVITITGVNLTGSTGVTFGGTAGTAFTVNSPTSITVTTPAHTAGNVAVVVQNPAGNATAPTQFAYA